MALRLSTDMRRSLLDKMRDDFFSTGAARIRIRSGAPPANVQDQPGTVLASIDLPAYTLFDIAIDDGVMTLNAEVSDLSADATGTAGHFEICKDSGAKLAQGTITTTGNGGDMTFDSVNFVAGKHVKISSFTITMGGA